nr:hypothetical protein [Tanacetum cinerariifolium]
MSPGKVSLLVPLFLVVCHELIDEFSLLASKPFHLQPNVSLSSEPKDDDPLLENVTDYQNPLKSHLKTALKVITYLRSSPGKGINVIKQYASGIDLKAYSDADWARCIEAEYRALASVTSEVVWILKILTNLNCNKLLPVKVFCDNKSIIKIAANLSFHGRTKHLEIDLHFARGKLLLRPEGIECDICPTLSSQRSALDFKITTHNN